MMNSVGPRTEPWGTPDVTNNLLEFEPLITIKYWRWEWQLKYMHTGSEIWNTTNKICQYTLLSKPICAKEERNGPPSDNQGLPVPNPRYGCAIFHPACDTAHWYNITNSTYGGTSCTTEISYSVHGSSVAQDGMLLILELCPPSGSLSLTVGISIWGDTPASNIHHHIVMWKVTVYLCMCQRKM